MKNSLEYFIDDGKLEVLDIEIQKSDLTYDLIGIFSEVRNIIYEKESRDNKSNN